jgi:hypothetical protein
MSGADCTGSVVLVVLLVAAGGGDDCVGTLRRPELRLSVCVRLVWFTSDERRRRKKMKVVVRATAPSLRRSRSSAQRGRQAWQTATATEVPPCADRLRVTSRGEDTDVTAAVGLRRDSRASNSTYCWVAVSPRRCDGAVADRMDAAGSRGRWQRSRIRPTAQQDGMCEVGQVGAKWGCEAGGAQ